MPLSRTVAPYLTRPDAEGVEAVGGHWRHLAFHTGYQPAGALQPRDRPQNRRRRHLPNDASLVRLVSMLAMEANDEWLVGRSYISLGSMTTLDDNRSDGSLAFGSEEEVAKLAAA
jgi:hypothetical protein